MALLVIALVRLSCDTLSKLTTYLENKRVSDAETPLTRKTIEAGLVEAVRRDLYRVNAAAPSCMSRTYLPFSVFPVRTRSLPSLPCPLSVRRTRASGIVLNVEVYEGLRGSSSCREMSGSERTLTVYIRCRPKEEREPIMIEISLRTA